MFTGLVATFVDRGESIISSSSGRNKLPGKNKKYCIAFNVEVYLTFASKGSVANSAVTLNGHPVNENSTALLLWRFVSPPTSRYQLYLATTEMYIPKPLLIWFTTNLASGEHVKISNFKYFPGSCGNY